MGSQMLKAMFSSLSLYVSTSLHCEVAVGYDAGPGHQLRGDQVSRTVPRPSHRICMMVNRLAMSDGASNKPREPYGDDQV